MKKFIQASVATIWVGSLILGALMLMTGLGSFGVALVLFGVPFSIGLGLLATQ